MINFHSAGTTGYHVGQLPDSRSRRCCEKHGVAVNHRARQISKDDLLEFDYILTMDSMNYEEVKELAEELTPSERLKAGKSSS